MVMPLSNVQSVESRLYRFMPKQKNKDGMLKEILLKSVFFLLYAYAHKYTYKTHHEITFGRHFSYWQSSGN